MADMPPATVLNLNVPAVPLDGLAGLRHGALGSVGLIRAVRPEHLAELRIPVPDRDGVLRRVPLFIVANMTNLHISFVLAADGLKGSTAQSYIMMASPIAAARPWRTAVGVP